MKPFQEFRFWATRAPVGERVATAAAAVIVLSLLAWLVVPTDDESARVDTFAAGAAGSASAAATSVHGGVQPSTPGGAAASRGDGPGDETEPGSAAAADDASTTGGGVGSGGTAGVSDGGGASSVRPAGCVSPPGTAKGIGDNEVKIVVALTELLGPAGNVMFDIPPPDLIRADFEATIAGINREDGVACRKLVAQYVNVNPADEASMMRQCREFADSDVFAIVDTGGMSARPAVLACLGQRRIPYFGGYFITEKARLQFYPYLFSFYSREQLYRNTAFALRDIGFFDAANGFKKLGFIYRDCEREAVEAYRGWIRDAGVPDSLVVSYTVGCPSVFASEAGLAQAVLTFQREGVTHVTIANFSDISRFTAHAEQQRFRPRYGVPDESLSLITGGTRAPNPDNFANAIAITPLREGEQRTPGMSPTPGTLRCDAYRRAAGLPPAWQAPTRAQNCNQLWMLQHALNRAPQLSPSALQVGLQRTRSIDFSFPQGPNDFSAPRATTGGQHWRVVQFMPDCDCWRVVQRDFRAPF